MKKIFMSIILLVSSWHGYAQLQFGVRAGVHWGTVVQARDAIEREFLPGFAVAVPIQWSLTDRWAIRADPSFIQKGWQTNVDYVTDLGTPAGAGRMIVRYSVADFPLLVSFRSKAHNRLTYYGVLGPSVGYILGGQFKIKGGNSPLYSDQLYFEDRLATGIWGGGGVEVPVGRVTAFVDARYHYGLSRNLPFAYQGSTQGFTVSVGCWWPSKK